jgi:ABC-type multidrug transport system fused ATPase/permease subunit
MNALPPLLTRRRVVRLAALCAAGLVLAASAAAGTLVMRLAFSDPSGANRPALGLALVGLGLLGAAALVAERRIAERLAQQYVAAIRRRLLRATLDRDQRSSGPSRGAALLRFVGDLGAVRNWIANGVARLVVAALVIPAAILVLAAIDLRLAAWPIASTLACLVAMIAAGPRLERAHDEARRARVALANGVGETLHDPLPIRALGIERRILRRLRRRSADIVATAVARRTRAAVVQALPEIAAAFAAAATVWIGLARIARGTGDAGELAAALAAIAMLVAPLRHAATALDHRRGFLVAKRRLLRSLDDATTRVAPRDGLRLPDGDGHLTLDAFRLAATSGPADTFVGAGTLALVRSDDERLGTQLLCVLAGLADWHDGDVRLDGQSLRLTRRDDLRGAIALISPRIPLPAGTLRGYLRTADSRADDDALRERLGQMGLHAWLAQFDDGLDTRIAEGGANLPQVLRGRAAVLRALLQRPRLLLLDQPETLLDDVALATLLRWISATGLTTIAASRSARLAHGADLLLELSDVGLRPVFRALGSSSSFTTVAAPAAPSLIPADPMESPT